MLGPKLNRFLQSLSSDVHDRIVAVSDTINLPSGVVLHNSHERSRYVYFLTAGLLSSVITTASGKSAEVALTGCEGLVGGMQLLGPKQPPTRAIIQIEGSAFRVRTSELKRILQSSDELRDRLLEFVQSESYAALQIAGCHRLHSTEQRMARWLLMVMDRIQSHDLKLTHSFLGIMLGSGRPTVTLVLQDLARRSLIETHRGGITIVDRVGLERSACECYSVAREYFDTLYRRTSSGR